VQQTPPGPEQPEQHKKRKMLPSPDPAQRAKAIASESAKESARVLNALTAAVKTAAAPAPVIQVKKVYSSGEKSLTSEQRAKHAAWRAGRRLQKLARATSKERSEAKTLA
jgi:hypothetical protein